MEFKKLELDSKDGRYKRLFLTGHFKRSIVFIILGAISGFLFFYLTEGKHMDMISIGDILRSAGIGAFFGFFITNSPCARGRC